MKTIATALALLAATPLTAQPTTASGASQQATASLPPPRKVETLTLAERNEVAAALGIDPAALKNPDPQP